MYPTPDMGTASSAGDVDCLALSLFAEGAFQLCDCAEHVWLEHGERILSAGRESEAFCDL